MIQRREKGSIDSYGVTSCSSVKDIGDIVQARTAGVSHPYRINKNKFCDLLASHIGSNKTAYLINGYTAH